MKPIKAVLFDLDGLMVDSEPLHLEALNEVLKKYSKYLSPMNNKYIGVSEKEAAENMVIRFHLPISAQELVLAKQEIYRRIVVQRLTTQPGLIKLLKKLYASRYKTAIASGSTLENIRLVIEKLEITRFINVYCSGNEVEKGKPAPDIYLLAAEKLGVKPSECLVLEDAPKGVQAGKAAGMRVFAIPSQYTKDQDFSMADRVLNSLSEVFSLL